MKKLFSHPLFWVLVLSIFPLWTLFVPGLPFTHDGQDHVARIANFYQSLAEGNIVPRWAANLNWGYGHPILMFLYPLPSYIASFFHAMGFPLVDSVKIVFGAAFVASALTMYLWLSKAFGKAAAVVGTLFYQFAPYRFVDLYVRGDLGEHVAFVFPPLAMYFVLLTSRSKSIRSGLRNALCLSFSVAALILAHNAVAIMFLPIIVLYGIYLLFETKNRWLFILESVGAVAAGFCLSAFFWIPALIEGKYTLRNIVTAGGALTRFVSWPSFFYSPWSYGGTDELSKAVGLIQWLGIVVACIVLIRIKSMQKRIFGWGTLIIFLLSLYIMTSNAAFLWEKIMLLQNFQFPWRFLAVSVFAAAVLGAVAVEYGFSSIRQNQKKWKIIVLSVLIVAVTVFMWHPKGNLTHSESFYSGIYNSTTDTGESSPIWSIRFMEHTALAPSQVISGDASILTGKRTTTSHQYDITAGTQARILENTLYFPGWIVYVDGVSTSLQWQDPQYRGLMTYMLTPGVHHVLVKFENTKLRTYSSWLSIMTLGCIVLLFLSFPLWKEKK